MCDRLKVDLLKALHSGDDDGFDSILNRLGPDWDPNDPVYPRSGDTVIHLVARLGRIRALKSLVTTFGTRLNFDTPNTNDYKRPLHEAAQFSQHEIISELLRPSDTRQVKQHENCTILKKSPVKAHLFLTAMPYSRR